MTIQEYKKIAYLVEQVEVLKRDLRQCSRLRKKAEEDSDTVLDIKSNKCTTIIGLPLVKKENELDDWAYDLGQRLLSQIEKEIQERISSIELEIAQFQGTKTNIKEEETNGSN